MLIGQDSAHCFFQRYATAKECHPTRTGCGTCTCRESKRRCHELRESWSGWINESPPRHCCLTSQLSPVSLYKPYDDRMRALNLIFLGFLLVSSEFCRPLAAQAPAPRNELSLDASVFAGGLSYAHLTSSGKLLGAGAGLGYEFNIRMVAGEKGRKKSTEVAHVEIFTRLRPPGRWQYDLGVRAAADIHSAQVASEPELGGFLGGYVAPMWGWRHFRIGPRVEAGAYWLSPVPTFGIFVTPLTARLLF